MKTGKERIYRTIGGSLLGSNLTQNELMELSERLILDSHWTAGLGEYLRELFFVSYSNKKYDVMRRGEFLGEDVQLAGAEIAELFSRRKVRKNDALKILAKMGKTKKWRPNSNRTVRQNAVDLVKSLESVDDISSVIYEIRHLLGYSGDPYLDALS